MAIDRRTIRAPKCEKCGRTYLVKKNEGRAYCGNCMPVPLSSERFRRAVAAVPPPRLTPTTKDEKMPVKERDPESRTLKIEIDLTVSMDHAIALLPSLVAQAVRTFNPAVVKGVRCEVLAAPCLVDGHRMRGDRCSVCYKHTDDIQWEEGTDNE